ncbi:MAG: ATP-binding protein [Candidatus Methanospirareceae archaeon]
MKVKRNPNEPISNLEIGAVIEVDGTHIVAELDPMITELTRVYGGTIYPIGQFGSIIKIHFGARLIFGYVGRLRMKSEYEREKGLAPESVGSARIIEADLFGEGEWLFEADEWNLEFERGVTTFPLPKQKVYLTPRDELGFIYGEGTGPVILLGEHVGSGGTPCYAEMNELLGKHTAILGSTGAGKSGTVAAILHAILDRGKEAGYEKWHPQIIVLDPHNEYSAAFPDHVRLCTDEDSLKLPYWLLNLEETVSLFVGKTEEAATSQTNIVMNALLIARQEGAWKLGIPEDKINVDSPIPYFLGDPSGLDELGFREGQLEEKGFVGAVNSLRPDGKDKKKHEGYHKVIRKVAALCRDGRMRFMMDEWDGNSDDLFPAVVKQFLGDSAPIRIIDLSGVPNEVAGAASSAIARTLFSVKLWQNREERENTPVLLVCEEAHRYVPNRGEAQYEAAQDAIRRLAKEGRKYGIGLMLVSQRPSEVEATVLSQCNSWIVMRITNDSDRSHVQGILPDSLAGLTKVLSGLRRREAIFVGQAAVLPSRILIRDLVKAGKPLPRSQDIDFDAGWQGAPITDEHLTEVGKRWRLQRRDV